MTRWAEMRTRKRQVYRMAIVVALSLAVTVTCCAAPPGADVFLQPQDETDRVSLMANDFRNAATAWTLEEGIRPAAIFSAASCVREP